MQRAQRLWKESLQFRALGNRGHHDVPELLDGGLVLVEPDCVESFENQKGQALAESESGFRNVQSVLDSSEARSDSEIRRNVSLHLTVLDAGSSGKCNWILVPWKVKVSRVLFLSRAVIIL